MFKEIAEKYTGYGLSIIPVNENKMPLGKWTQNQFQIVPPDDRFDKCDAIGLVCGKVSGGLTVIDIDLKYDITGNLYDLYKKEINECDNTLLKKMVVQKTKNGGYHFLFRCDHSDGNLKLANRYVTEHEKGINSKERIKVLIETRSEGGYIVISPSSGYEIVYGSLDNIQTITQEQKHILYDCAKLFNEVKPVLQDDNKRKNITDLSPFDDFNDRGDVIGILEQDGWKVVIEKGDKIMLLRPGGTGKWSADYDTKKRLLYMFSSSTEFDNEKAYNPSQVLTYLRFNRDYSESAKWLLKNGYGNFVKKEYTQNNTTTKSTTELDAMLNDSFLDLSKEIAKPPTVLSIREGDDYRRLFTLGNFSCIIGKAKSKKTFAMTMLTAAIISGNDTNHKFKGEMPDGKDLVVYIDTEQGRYDSQYCMKRIERMATKTEKFKAYNFRPYSAVERVQLLEHLFKEYGNRIAFCVIDGIADLANTFNDEKEATQLTSMLMRLTADYNCHITTVIHQNKNDNFATGHLGSSIMKKSEMIISLAPGENGKNSSIISSDFSRSLGFEPFVMVINEHGIPEIADDYQFIQQQKNKNYTEPREEEIQPF